MFELTLAMKFDLDRGGPGWHAPRPLYPRGLWGLEEDKQIPRVGQHIQCAQSGIITLLRLWNQQSRCSECTGVYKGRPAPIDPAQVRQLKAGGMGPSKIAKMLGIGRALVYRASEA